MIKFEDGISSDFINFFIRYRDERLSSDKAISEYIYFINLFYKATGSTPVDCDANVANAYMNKLKSLVMNGELKYSTAMARRSMLRSMRQYAMDEGIIAEPMNVFAMFNFSDNSNPNNKVLPSEAELYSLFDLASDDARAKLIFALIIKCGLKTSELIHLCRNDFCNTNKGACLRIRGKNTRYLYLPDDCLPYVEAYFNEYNFILPTSPAFVNKRKTALKQRDCDRLINSYIEKGLATGVIHNKFTAADVRLVSIAGMLCGASACDTAQYAGITNRWLFRLDYEVELLMASRYSVLELPK